MLAYLFIKTKINDPDQYAKYAQAVREVAAKWGSRYIVRSRPVEVLEGSPEQWGDYLLLVSEWPSANAARAFWSPEEYRKVRELRANAGEVHVVLTEELPPPSAAAFRAAMYLAALRRWQLQVRQQDQVVACAGRLPSEKVGRHKLDGDAARSCQAAGLFDRHRTDVDCGHRVPLSGKPDRVSTLATGSIENPRRGQP